MAKRKRNKNKFTAMQTMKLLSDNVNGECISSVGTFEILAFKGNIALDASFSNSTYRLPNNIMVFGDFTYEDTLSSLKVSMPSQVSCTGDFSLTSSESLTISNRKKLDVQAKNILIDHMGRTDKHLISNLHACESITIKNFNGKVLPYDVFAQILVLDNCPNIKFIQSHYVDGNHVGKIQIVGDTSLLDSNGCVIKDEIVINNENYIEHLNHKKLLSGERISINVSSGFDVPKDIETSILDIDSATLPDALSVCLNKGDVYRSGTLLVKNCNSKGESCKITVVSNAESLSCIDISNSSVSDLDVSATYVSDFKANGSMLKALPERVVDYGVLDISNTQISELPSNINASNVSLIGSKVTYLPPIFVSPYLKIRADFNQLTNAIQYPLVFNGEQTQMIMFAHDGVDYIITPETGCFFPQQYSIEEYLVHINSNNEHYPAPFVRYIESHILEAKLMLKRKLKAKKANADIALMSL